MFNTKSSIPMLAALTALSLGGDIYAPRRIHHVKLDADAMPKAPDPVKVAPKVYDRHLVGAWKGDGIEPTKVTRQMRRRAARGA